MKIGILTLYYNNMNYGGVLQAYALVKYLNSSMQDIDAEQITCDFPFEKRSIREKIEDRKQDLIFALINKIKASIKNSFEKKLFNINQCKIRIKKIEQFKNNIPHSEEINIENISVINKEYDAFITGSDQVWSPVWYRSACFLDFVVDEKKKISYAASMGINNLFEQKAKKIIPLVKRMDSVSVREKRAKEILENYIKEKKIEVVVDPVLLLPEIEWSKIATGVMGEKKYAFSYFLGENKTNLNNARKIAEILKLPIAAVPYIHMRYSKIDKKLMDIPVYDAGPCEFLGLIKDAEIIITDSFHAVVFSIIFRKKFIVFKRDKDTQKNSMNSRITDLLEELNLEERIIASSKQLTAEFLNKEIDYTYAYSVLDEKKKFSMDFLYKAIMS